MHKQTLKTLVVYAVAAVAAFSAFGGEVAQDEAREAVKGKATLEGGYLLSCLRVDFED